MAQRGIALFQVLLMMAIISVLLVVITGYSQFSVDKATISTKRLQAKLNTYSRWSEVSYHLLTEDWFNGHLNGIAGSNFFGKDFSMGTSTVSIQNQNSLLYVGTGGSFLTHALVELGIDKSRAKQLTDALDDWQDADDKRRLLGAESKDYNQDGMPSNLPIQYIYELGFIKGWDSQIINDIKPLLTLHPNGILNPALMPPKLMSFYVSPGEVEVLEEARSNGSYSLDKFSQVTGIQGDEFLRLNPSNRLVVTVKEQAKDGSFNTYIRAVFDVHPYRKKPIILREIEWR